MPFRTRAVPNFYQLRDTTALNVWVRLSPGILRDVGDKETGVVHQLNVVDDFLVRAPRDLDAPRPRPALLKMQQDLAHQVHFSLHALTG